MKWSLGEEAAVVPAKCCGSNSTKWWKWWRIMCWQHCASQMEAVPCTEFSFNSLLPMLTLWGFFCVCLFFFRELVFLIPWKQHTQFSAAWVLVVLLCVPESNEYKFKLTVNAICDAVWCTSFCFGLLGLCGTRSCHLLFFCGCCALFFVVLCFKRSEAQTNNWLNKNQSAETSLKIM